MDKKDLIPSCLQAFQDDPHFRISLKSAMPVKSHPAFDAVERDGMFLPNGMMSQPGHDLVRQLNTALPAVEEALSALDDPAIRSRATEYRNGVESRRSAHRMARQPAQPGLLKPRQGDWLGNESHRPKATESNRSASGGTARHLRVMRPTPVEPGLREVRVLRRCQGAVQVAGLPAAQMAGQVIRLTGRHGREAPRRS
jgi:hypothetical protein